MISFLTRGSTAAEVPKCSRTHCFRFPLGSSTSSSEIGGQASRRRCVRTTRGAVPKPGASLGARRRGYLAASMFRPLEGNEHNSYYERPGYARADAPQVLEEGETREGEGRRRGETKGGAEGGGRASGRESPKARTRGKGSGAGDARQAGRPVVRHRRRARRPRRAGPHRAGDEGGLRETDRCVSRRRGGVPHRLPRSTVPGRHPGPRGLAGVPRAGGVRAGGAAQGGEPPAQLVQADR